MQGCFFGMTGMFYGLGEIMVIDESDSGKAWITGFFRQLK